MSEIDSKPYHRQPGEPNRWFQRFLHFLDLGPGRSVTRCYREIINVERARDGRPLLPTTASCPTVWRQRASQFDWKGRAAAWDRQQRRRKRQEIEDVRDIATGLSPLAIRILESTMRGELKNPDGTLAPGQNCTQRRLAAEKILDLVGVGLVTLEDDDQDDSGGITKFVILDHRSPEAIARAEQTRRQASARYQARTTEAPDRDQQKRAKS